MIVLVFVSLVLVTAAVVMFIMRVRGGDFEHAERLSLLPLEDEARSGRRGDGNGGTAAVGPDGPASGGEQ